MFHTWVGGRCVQVIDQTSPLVVTVQSDGTGPLLDAYAGAGEYASR
jgi:hypothetical protein